MDPLKPVHNLLIHRFDGDDERIYAFDANLQQWRHVPDIPTFQDRGYYWCDVTAANERFYDNLTIGRRCRLLPDPPGTTTPPVTRSLVPKPLARLHR